MNSESLKLYAVLLGGRVTGYLVEQHKYLFCVAGSLEGIKVKARDFWPEAEYLHIDAYVCLDQVGGYWVVVQEGCGTTSFTSATDLGMELFFIYLGGYRKGLFMEVHEPIFIVAQDKFEAKKLAKHNPFFEDETLIQDKESRPHVDDTVGVNTVKWTRS